MSETEKNACADIHKCLDVAKASVRGAAAADLELPAEEQEGRASKRTRASNQTQPRPPTPSPKPPPSAAVASVPIAPGPMNTMQPTPETPPQLRTFPPGPPAPIKVVRQVMRRIQDPDESRDTEVCTACMLDLCVYASLKLESTTARALARKQLKTKQLKMDPGTFHLAIPSRPLHTGSPALPLPPGRWRHGHGP